MKNFDYFEPSTLEEALKLKQDYGKEAKFLAGGTDIFVQIKNKKDLPGYLIDLKEIEDIKNIEEEDGTINIGAGVTITQIKETELIKEHFPSLQKAACNHGSEQVRNLATIGGNLCNGAPSNEMSPPLLTFEAQLELLNSSGKTRLVDLKDFIVGPSKTQIQEDEILTRIIVPKWEDKNVLCDYERYGIRNHMDLALASVGVLLEFEADKKTVKKANIALGGVAPTPMCLPDEEEKELENSTLTEEKIQTVAELASKSCSPSGRRIPADYRRQVIGVMIKRILTGMKESLVNSR